jgi:hypothetical protein
MHTPNRKCVNKYDLQDSLWMENIWKFFSRLIARACAISVTELFIPDTYLNISGLKQKRERTPHASRGRDEKIIFLMQTHLNSTDQRIT